ATLCPTLLRELPLPSAELESAAPGRGEVEWHPGELYPRVGFIVTNLHRPAKKVVAFYNGRGTAEQWIKEGKQAVKWTRLSCVSCARMPSDFSSTRWPTTSPISSAPWLCRARSRSGP